MAALSDHLLVVASIRTSFVHSTATAPTTNIPQTVYKWAEGTDVRNYAKSATSWLEYTQRPEFADELL